MSGNNLFPIAFMDAPKVLNASVTPIPGSGSAPVQVVANLGHKAAHAIDYIDNTGDYIGVYTGPIGQEILVVIIGGGAVTRAYVVIPALARVSLRSITSSPITNGYLSMNFMGMGYY